MSVYIMYVVLIIPLTGSVQFSPHSHVHSKSPGSENGGGDGH